MRKNLLSLVILCLFSGLAYSAEESIFVLNESFEGGVIPEGWTQEYVNSSLYGEHPWVVESASEAQNPAGVASGNYRIALRNETNATIGYTTRLISPVMNLAYGEIVEPILVFSHAQQQRTGDFDQLKVYFRSSTDSRWVRIDEDRFNTKIPTWQRDTIKLSSQSSTYQVMFEVTDNFGYGVVLDDIQVRPMPTCVEPYNFISQSLTSTSAIISWNASFDTDSFEVALSTQAFESLEDAQLSALTWYGFVSDDIFQFSTTDKGLELSRGTTYYLYVRAYCQGAISEWTAYSFRTKNLVNLPLTVNFTPGEGWEYKSGTINHIANWSFGTSIKKDDGSMEYMPFVNTHTEPNSSEASRYAWDGGFCLVFTGERNNYADIPAGQYVYCATPEINLESLKNVRVSFWGTAYQDVSSEYASGIIIGVMTDPEDFTTFVPVDTCYQKVNATFNKFSVSLEKYTGEGKYIAFASDFKDKLNTFYVDNIVIAETNAPVFPANLALKNVSAKSIEVNLNSKGSNYNLVVAKRTLLANGNIILDPANIDSADVITVLTNQTAQSLTVDMPQSLAGQFVAVYAQGTDGVNVSDWTLPAVTRLPMYLSTADLPYKVDWELNKTWQETSLYPFGSNGVSTNYPNDIITATLTAQNAYGPNRLYLSTMSGTASQEGNSAGHWAWFRIEGNEVTKGDPELYSFKHEHGTYAALPEVDDVTKVFIKFYMERYSTTVEGSSRVAVGVMTDPYDINTFETVATFESTSATEYQPFTCTFENYKGNGKFIAIQAVEAEQRVSGGSLSGSSYAWNNYYYSEQRLDWINIFAIGECNPITAPQVEATDNSAKISWSANNMSQWQVRVQTLKGENLLDTLVDSTSITITGLNAHTEYKYMVSPTCDKDYELSDWLTFKTECVPGEKLPFIEDFESADYTVGSSQYFIPYCWTSPIYSYTYSGDSKPSYYPYISRSTSNTWGHNSNTMFALYSNSSSTAQNQLWVALPRMAAPIDSLQIEFYVKGYSLSQNSMLQVGVMTDPSDLSTFEVVDSINVVGTAWGGYVVKFNNYKGEGKYIALKRDYERDKSVQYYLDDIIVDYITDCEKIFSITVNEPKINGATFKWAKTAANQYEVLVTSKSVNPAVDDTTGLVIDLIQTDSNALVYTNGDLNLNTNYYVHVRAICGTTKTSWSDEAVFKTTCLPQTSEQIGTINFTDANSLGCWTTGVNSGTTSAPYRAGSATGKSGFYLYIWNSTASDGAYAIMPPLDVDDISLYQVKFDVGTSSSLATNVKRITVGVISNAADLSTFVPITTVTDLPYINDSTDYMPVTIALNDYDGDYVTGAKGNQVMFIAENGDSTDYVQIDNIRFELIPNCAYPTKINVDSVGTYGSKLSWNKTGELYELAICATKAAPNKDNAQVVKILSNIKDETATVDGLEMLTTYFAYVRTICGEGDTSLWSDPKVFKTICPDSYSLPFMQDFESCPGTAAADKPDCWTYYYVSGTTINEGKPTYPQISSASYSHNSTKCMYFYSSASTITPVTTYAALPYINEDLKKAMISFWYRANVAGTTTAPNRKLLVGIADEVSTLDTLLSTLVVIDTVVSEVATYEKYSSIIGDKYEGNGKYIVLIGFGGNGATSTGGMYVDDIEVSLVPTCFMPDNLTAKMYDTEALLSWDQLQGNSTTWEVGYALTGSDIADLTVVSVSQTPELTVSNLQPSTTYDFYVRAICGEGDVSDWRGPLTAATLYQVALKDAQWTFENGEPTKNVLVGQSYLISQSWYTYNYVTGSGTVGSIPRITSNSYLTTGQLSSRYALSGDSALLIYGSGAYVALPVVADADYDSLELHFFARAISTYPYRAAGELLGQDSVYSTTYAYKTSSYAHTVRVGVATDPYDISTLEELTVHVTPTVGTTTSTKVADAVDPEGTSWWREIVVPLYGVKGKYIILASPQANNNVYIDNVSIVKVDGNTCSNVTKLAYDEETLTYDKVEFTWLSPKQQFKVNVVETETGKAFITDKVVSSTSIAITGLTEQTTYTISVEAICAEGETSKATTANFTTPCKPFDLESASWNFAENLVQWGTSATYVNPGCWDQGQGTTNSASYTPYSAANTATYMYGRQMYTDDSESTFDRALRFYTTATYSDAYAVMPEPGFELDSMTLHFYGRAAYFYAPTYSSAVRRNQLYSSNSSYERKLIIGVIEDPTDISTFTPIDTIEYTNVWSSTSNVFAYDDESGNNYWQEYALPLAKYAGKGRITFLAPKSTSTSYFFVDDVEIVHGDFCTPVTGAAIGNVTSTTAHLRWADILNNNNVAVQVATSSDFNEKSIVYSDTISESTSVVVSGLQPATTYYYTFKHICNLENGDESNWTPTNSFTTNHVIRFSENFNDVNTTLPKGWTRSNNSSAADIFSGAKVFTEATVTASYAWRTNVDNDMQVYANTTTNNASSLSSYQYHWLFTPAIDLTENEGDKLMLSFDIALRGSTSIVPNPNNGVEEYFMVVVSQDGGKTWNQEDATVWSTEGDGNFDYAELFTRGKLTQKYIDMSKYAGKTVKLAFYSGSYAGSQVMGSKNILLLDNIQLNTYTSASYEAEICRWEDFSGYGFDLDADQLPAGENIFYDFKPATKNGEDDIYVELKVEVHTDAVNTLDTVVLCEGEQFNQFNFNFVANESGEYKQKLQSVAGCDSTVVLYAIVNPRQYNDVVAAVCQGSYYEFNGVRYYTSIEQTDTIASLVTGCDSIVTLHLTINDILTEDEGIVYVCEGETYNFTDNYPAISVEGIYVDTVQNEQGCDVVKTIEVKQAYASRIDIRAAICSGESYDEGIFSGLTRAGIYETPAGVLKTEHGCDSIISLTLLVANGANDTIEDNVTNDQLPYVLNGEEIFGTDAADKISTATVNLGCGEVTLIVKAGTATGLYNNTTNTVAVAPNPAKVGERVQILTNFSAAQMSQMTIDVFSSTGMLISRQQPRNGDMSIEPIAQPGIYMVVVKSGNDSWQSKLIVE